MIRVCVFQHVPVFTPRDSWRISAHPPPPPKTCTHHFGRSLIPNIPPQKKVIKSAGVALAWYLASSAVAVAATAATGGAVRARPQPRMRYTGLPILLMAYALSRGDLKERTRCVFLFVVLVASS